MVRVAVVGCGYWGPNVVRNLASLEGCEVRALCDSDPGRLASLHRRFPAALALSSYQQILDDPEIDGVAVCTPVHTHYPLAAAALQAGKHVLVEKPLSDSVETAEILVEQAESRGLVLMVDHTFVYSGAVQKMRSIIDAGELGRLLYFDSVRVNLGLFQSDINVVWDLAPHDLSILTYLVDQTPKWVSAIGTAHYGKLENLAYLTVMFEDSLIAHLHLNWLAPVKIRSTLIGGSQRMIVYDDLEPSEKIRVYDKGVTLHSDSASRERALVDYRAGDMYAPYIDKHEPLQRVCETFVQAIASGHKTATDGRVGLQVVRVLEAAQQSIRKSGERIAI